MKKYNFAIFMMLMLAISLLAIQSVNADSSAIIWTDKDDYSPEETVIIYGIDFLPNTPIVVSVERPDGIVTSSLDSIIGAYNISIIYNIDGTTDQFGKFIATYQLNGILGTYNVTSTDGTNTATITFTDGSKVGSVAVGPQSPNPVTAGYSATYTVTVNRGTGGGSSGAFTADLSITTALPTGVSASFSPNPVSFTPSQNSRTSTLTISTSTSTPAGSTSFTVKAATSATDFAIVDGTLAIQAADTTPPTGSISINSGTACTASTAVTLSLTYADVGGSGVDKVRYSNNGVTYDPWENAVATKSWSLTSGDGTKTVYYQVRDIALNIATFTDSIILDTVSPVVTITAPLNGVCYKSSVLPAAAFSVVETNSYGTPVEVGYSTAEGSHTYTVTVTDCAGNIGSASVTYIVDDTAPVVTITAPINGGYYNLGTVPAAAFTVIELNTYNTPVETGYSTALGTHTYTVTVTDCAGNIGSDSVTYYVGATSLTYTGDLNGQYSDPITVSAKLRDLATMNGISGKIISFTIGTQSTSATTDSNGDASTTITLNQISGNYNVISSFAGDSSYCASSDSDPFTINKETVTIEYTGDIFVWTNPGETEAPIRFSAILTQQNDGYPGDLSLAKVMFSVQFTNVLLIPAPVNTLGEALVIKNIPIGGPYDLVVNIQPNQYWTISFDTSALTVSQGNEFAFVTGGGWIPDSQSINNKGNFGFTVQYNKKADPKGNFIYIWRGNDGYNYKVKSNSWQGGGLWFTGTNGAYFTGKCTFTKINRATGEEITIGNCVTTITITDGDLTNPKTIDTFAITILNGKNVIRQIGTSKYPIELGGGNIVIHK